MRSCMNRSPTKKNKEIKYRRKRKNKENQKKFYISILAEDSGRYSPTVSAAQRDWSVPIRPQHGHRDCLQIVIAFLCWFGKIKWDSIFVFRRKCAQWLCLHLPRLVFVMLSKWDSQDTKSGSREVEWSLFAGCKKRFFFSFHKAREKKWKIPSRKSRKTEVWFERD